MASEKLIQDAVHGLIEVEPLIIQLIDTPEFQRLRLINQLGSARFVFPTCTHTRFEHCIGTYHLARRLLNAMKVHVPSSEVQLTEAESMAVKIAAACHDIGHGPFSHLWEEFVKSGGSKYSSVSHEVTSCHIIQRIVDGNENIASTIRKMNIDLNLVYALIRGEKNSITIQLPKEKLFIFELLNNVENGIDVDKWDYIMRDSFYIGWGQGCSVLELDRFLTFYRPFAHQNQNLNSMQVIEHGKAESKYHMSFRDSEIENVLSILNRRLRLHRQVYSHKAIKAIDKMLIDILDLLDPFLNLREISLKCTSSSDALSAFLRLNDYILLSIGSNSLPLQLGRPDLTDALRYTAYIFRRIEARHIYLFVGSVYCSNETQHREIRPSVTFNHSYAHMPYSGIPSSFDVFLQKDSNQETLIPLANIGTSEEMLHEIMSMLPTDSIVKDMHEFRLSQHTFRSNSTNCDPNFYFYTSSGETFTLNQPLHHLIEIRLYWTCPNDDIVGDKSTCPPCLHETFKRWRTKKMQSSLKTNGHVLNNVS